MVIYAYLMELTEVRFMLFQEFCHSMRPLTQKILNHLETMNLIHICASLE